MIAFSARERAAGLHVSEGSNMTRVPPATTGYVAPAAPSVGSSATARLSQSSANAKSSGVPRSHGSERARASVTSGWASGRGAVASGGVLAGGVDPGAEVRRVKKVAVTPLAMTVAVAAAIHAAAGMRGLAVGFFEPGSPESAGRETRATPDAESLEGGARRRSICSTNWGEGRAPGRRGPWHAEESGGDARAGFRGVVDHDGSDEGHAVGSL